MPTLAGKLALHRHGSSLFLVRLRDAEKIANTKVIARLTGFWWDDGLNRETWIRSRDDWDKGILSVTFEALMAATLSVFMDLEKRRWAEISLEDGRWKNIEERMFEVSASDVIGVE
ncbi:hypothetical protein NX059_008194 [Plenodomus lindquistii]|nr:hypothetical protein NX059_008194 [Plenodomus lindquistii]